MTWEQEIEEAKQYAREEAREEGLREGREEGRAEGRAEERLETAKNFLKKHYEPSDIAECTGLPLEQVLALQKEICITVD